MARTYTHRRADHIDRAVRHFNRRRPQYLVEARATLLKFFSVSDYPEVF